MRYDRNEVAATAVTAVAKVVTATGWRPIVPFVEWAREVALLGCTGTGLVVLLLESARRLLVEDESVGGP